MTTRRLLGDWRKAGLPILTGTLLGLAACSPPEAPKAETTPEAAPPADATIPAADATPAQDAQAQEWLAQLDAQLDKLQDQLSQLGPEAQEQAEIVLNDLRAKRDELLQYYNSDEMQKTLEQAKSATSKWTEQAQQAANDVADHLQNAMDSATENANGQLDEAKNKAQGFLDQMKQKSTSSQPETAPEATPPAETAPQN